MGTDVKTAGNLVRDLKYPTIDGIRCYAAFIVYLVHFVSSVAIDLIGIPETKFNMASGDPLTVALSYLSDGNHGVDAFFIVSGFLMARIVSTSNRKFRYWGFISGRFRRIYPAFLATLIIATLVRCLALDWTFKPVDFAMNLVFANAVPGATIIPYNYVSWSLGYEFAFYLIIPILRALGHFVDVRIAGAVLLLGAFALVPDSILRADGLFVGALVGCFPDERLKTAAAKIPLMLVLPAYLAMIPAKGFALITYKEFYFPFIVLAALLFIRLVFGSGRLVGWLQSTPMRVMGTISYSFYLLHTVAIGVALHWVIQPLGTHSPLWLVIPLYFVTSLSIAVLGAWGSFWLFERFYFSRGEHEGASARSPIT